MKTDKKFQAWIGYAILAIAGLITVVISLVLYNHTVDILIENLKKREIAIVQTAALQFKADELNQLQTEKDWNKPVWNSVVNRLINIRLNNEDIVFAYILRKVEDNQMVFIADSHSYYPYAQVDLDENGVIDDADQLNWPGQIYDDVPEEAIEGYDHPVTNKELYEDQWGSLISGYAPIKDGAGNTVAVMVVDIRANEFSAITQQTYIPFIFFIVVLLGILLVLAESLIKIWNKRIELVIELDRQKDELLGIVSHQLATPVSSVRWYLEMLQDGDLGQLSAEQSKHIKSVQGVVDNLVDLVHMILDVSRIQLGRMKLEKQDLNLNVFFKEILQVIEPKAKEKMIKFNVSVPGDLPEAKLDRRYTRMTIENILSNAVKYTPNGGEVDLSVSLENDTMFISVKDTGVGIPKSDQDKIFGKLFRASNVRNSVDGNGFGLYIAKGAIEAQGGDIKFESEEGKGTKFEIRLPLN